MKHKSIIGIILVFAFLITGTNTKANNPSMEIGIHHSSTQPGNFSEKGSHDAKTTHGKTGTPHSDELPHIHKFHKERVKKIKKHQGKFWLLSKLILVICHLSILLIAYLHVVH